MEVYRQGDVALVRVTPVRGAVGDDMETARVVLAEGEASQHVHVLRSNKTGEQLRVLYEGPRRWQRWGVDVPEGGARLEHTKRGTLTGEHDTLVIPKGRYRIALQNEFTSRGVRRAAD